MLDKEINPKLAGAIIGLLGLIFLGYGIYQTDLEKFNFSFKSVFFPALFMLIVILFAYKAASTKDIEITSIETDKKIKNSIDAFKYKTRYIQDTLLGFWILILTFLLFVLCEKLGALKILKVIFGF